MYSYTSDLRQLPYKRNYNSLNKKVFVAKILFIILYWNN